MIGGPLLLLAFFVLGVAAGAAHLWLLRRNVDTVIGGGSAWTAGGLLIGRFALLTALLVLAAVRGWPELLACAVGLSLVRPVVMRRLARSGR